MLIQVDKTELGDGKLDGNEALIKFSAENQALLDKKKIKDQAELEDTKAALGQVLHTSAFIAYLQKVCPGLIVEKGGWPNAVALRRYVNGEKVYVTGFELGDMPEFSAVLTDDDGLPVREVRGWRNVLVSLIKQGLISVDAIKKQYGHAMNNVHGKFYESQIQGR
jgi:hypothetical protein